MELSVLKLTKKVSEALENANINDIDVVKEMLDDELLSIKGVTKKGLEEIRKKAKNVTTPKEQRDFKLKEITDRIHLIPEPTFKLSVGEELTIGNLRDAVVHEVFFDGKIYEIDYTEVNNNYGNPIATKNQRAFYKWMDVRKKNNNKQTLINNEDLRLSYSQREMTDILSKAYFFGLDLNPEYQRDFVWDLEDRVKLIDSIFNNVDIGKFVFVQLPFGGDYLYEVLDGKQRIRAILDFYEDRFEYKSMKFSDLSARDQSHIEGYAISTAEIKNITHEQKLKYFINLNTGGKAMSKDHIEKVKNMLNDAT